MFIMRWRKLFSERLVSYFIITPCFASTSLVWLEMVWKRDMEVKNPSDFILFNSQISSLPVWFSKSGTLQRGDVDSVVLNCGLELLHLWEGVRVMVSLRNSDWSIISGHWKTLLCLVSGCRQHCQWSLDPLQQYLHLSVAWVVSLVCSAVLFSLVFLCRGIWGCSSSKKRGWLWCSQW